MLFWPNSANREWTRCGLAWTLYLHRHRISWCNAMSAMRRYKSGFTTPPAPGGASAAPAIDGSSSTTMPPPSRGGVDG